MKKIGLVVLLVAIFFYTHAAAKQSERDVDTEGLIHLQTKLTEPEQAQLNGGPRFSPQPDTIIYDNNTIQYLETAADHWVGVRFTTVAPFELRSIYFAVLNDGNNTADGCSLYVVACDTLGYPDWPEGKLASLWVPPTLLDRTWMQVDLDEEIQFVTNDHFFIIYGPVPGGSFPGTGWWSLFDSDSTTGFRTHISFDNKQSWATLMNADAFVRAAGEYTAEFISDELFVYFSEGTNPTTIDSINQAIGCVVVDQFSYAFDNTTIDFYWLRITSDLSVPTAIEMYTNHPNVYFAEPNFVVEGGQRVLNNAEIWPDDWTFNPARHDTFGRQWALDNWGQALPFFGGVFGTVDADIDAPQMWRMLTDADVIVAIIDSGIDWGHPDLVGNIWSNPNEVAGDGVDNEPNGFIDDVRGWDFVPEPDDNDPSDELGHGTHVAGIVGARGNNGIGVCGVAWRVKLMAVRVLNSLNSGSWGNIASGIRYAVNNDAHILNLSLGGNGYHFGVHAAILWAEANDVLVVAAAGNNFRDIDPAGQRFYPASLSNVAAIRPIMIITPGPVRTVMRLRLPVPQNLIGVAASDHNDAKPGFSNWGATSVHLAAPGECIYSTMPRGVVTFNNWHNDCTGVNYSRDYDFMSGTSMAAPHVSGVAALCWTMEPWLTALELKDVLLDEGSSFNAADKEKKPAFRLGGASPVVTEGRLRAAQNADFGDAEDAPYPTFWPPLGWGALHLDCGLEWLGEDISLERSALDVWTDTDMIPNLIDQDGFDDGVRFFPPYFCKGMFNFDRVDVEVTVSNPISGRYGGAFPAGRFLYLDSFIDFNDDGDWADVFTCVFPFDAPEHLLIQGVGGPGAASVVGFVAAPPGNAVVIDPSLWGGPATQQSRRFELYFYSPPLAFVADETWSRFRIEYDDQVWPTRDNKFLGTEFDYSLFGEVEDYWTYLIPIGFIDLSASPEEDRVTLNWTTGTEFDYAGFNVYRSDTEDAEYIQLNEHLIPAHGSEVADVSYRYEDTDVETGETYFYKLESIDASENSTWHGPISITMEVTEVAEEPGIPVPDVFTLAQNYPNPFNVGTDIRYQLPEATFVSLKIYNILGQEIKILVNETKDAGYYTVHWNGEDNNGYHVTSGFYFYKIITEKWTDTKKMVLMK